MNWDARLGTVVAASVGLFVFVAIALFSWTLDFVVIACLAAAGGAGYLGYRSLGQEREQEQRYFALAVRLTLDRQGDESDLVEYVDLEHLATVGSRALAAEHMTRMAERYQRRPRTMQAILIALVLMALAVTLTIVDRVADLPNPDGEQPTETASDGSEAGLSEQATEPPSATDPATSTGDS
jgi:hypothetical protein